MTADVRYEGHGMSSGTVREWHDEEGWGVIDSPTTPGGCWMHYSHVDARGRPALSAGQEVMFSCEPVTWQDGFHWRAARVRPDGTEPAGPSQPDTDGTAFRSKLTLRLDSDS